MFSYSEEKAVNGHLTEGCNTTAEICVVEINNYKLTREYDETTGYKELLVKKIKEKANVDYMYHYLLFC